MADVQIRPKKGQLVKMKGPVSKWIFSVKIQTVRVKDKLVKVVPDYTGKNPMPYPHFWLEWEDLIF